ncbi:MAG TPA: glycosyltransferase family 39 protein [Clostridia bacterium]|nr:glycosyltransferase family 39 protein [Clostridia bacterium]
MRKKTFRYPARKLRSKLVLEHLSVKLIVGLSIIISIVVTLHCYQNHYIIAYGDAESHLNIAKRVIQGLTPGAAQLGGVWLPLPHLLMVPQVFSDWLWKTGLAGTVVSAIAFIFSSITIYKIAMLLSQKRLFAFGAALVFMLNPNILYLQATPMSELPLICFFLLNTYFFIKFIQDRNETLSLILAAFFGFLSSLSRYDGWILVVLEVIIIFSLLLKERKPAKEIEGKIILFSSLAFFGIFLWLAWNWLIFNDPLFFNRSQFSARAQQMAWSARGELPAYHNLKISIFYYLVTSVNNVGILIFSFAALGLIFFLFNQKESNRLPIALILGVPFIFYISSLFFGQSVIFTPELTPETFEWQLFNVRYGVMAVPACAIFFSYAFFYLYRRTRLSLILAIVFLTGQTLFYLLGYSNIITLVDGTVGLSAAKKVDAQEWLNQNYDDGLVLLDDYARAMSIIRTPIPMKNVIYIGTKPYWEESLREPEKYATWIIMQRHDEVWTHLYENQEQLARVYKYFNKVYTSDEILIFKRIN